MNGIEISALQKLSLKPTGWRLFEEEPTALGIDLALTLSVNFNPPGEPETWQVINTSRGKEKIYRSIKYVLADIALVQKQGVIHFKLR